jgi:plasmid stability protein
MTTLTIKNMPENVYERIKMSAKANQRSINKEIIAIVQQAVMPRAIDVDEWLNQTRQIRERTANYILSDEEITRIKNEGRP